MAKKTVLGSIKRYGPRYGAKNKEKVAALEILHRGYHKCPYCAFTKVKRLSAGIWECDKCSAKFAGKAYTYTHPKKSREVKKEEPVEAAPEEDMIEEDDNLDQEEVQEESSEETVEEVATEEPQEEEPEKLAAEQ